MKKFLQKIQCFFGIHKFHMWGELCPEKIKAKISITCHHCDIRLKGTLNFIPINEYMKKNKRWKHLKLIKG